MCVYNFSAGYIVHDDISYLYDFRNTSILPKQWNSLCFSLNSTDNGLTIVYNGVLLYGSTKNLTDWQFTADKLSKATLHLGRAGFQYLILPLISTFCLILLNQNETFRCLETFFKSECV
jgi:hypothetical protein